MRKFFGLMVALMVLAFAGASFAQDAAAPAPAATEVAATEAAAPAEFAGVIEVTPADEANKETEATIILDMGEKTYKLVIVAEKRAELEAANGKNVTVKGKVIAATEGQLMDSIEVAEWAEVAAPAEPATEEATEETATPDGE